MALFKATAQGQVEMTAQEEAEIRAIWDESDSIPNKKARIRSSINDERRIRQNNGVTINGVLYGTDLNSRIELSNAYIYLVRNQGAKVNIESKSGEILELDMKGIEAIYDAVNSHVSAVASVAKTHFDNLKLLTKNDIDSYNVKALWP